MGQRIPEKEIANFQFVTKIFAMKGIKIELLGIAIILLGIAVTTKRNPNVSWKLIFLNGIY